MAKTSKTTFAKQCEILGELWLEHSDDEEFKEFFEYNNLGVPLAYAIEQELVISTPKAERFIGESFRILLAGMEVEDTGFDSLSELMDLD
jgi:hypothetical protein